jgi:hypothetical protein
LKHHFALFSGYSHFCFPKTKAFRGLRLADQFGITHDSAENRIKRSREEGFLEPVKKVSAKRQKVKKGKGNAKRKKK